MIERLTEEQSARVAQLRAETFAAVTSCRTDRATAEAAAAIVVAPALRQYESHWAVSPMSAASLWASLWASLRDSLRASLSASLWASLSDSLRDSLSDSLRDSLWASLRDSLWASLRASLRDSLWDSLRDSLWDSLSDSGYLAFVVAGCELAGIADERTERVRAALRLVSTCSGIWVLPGHIILSDAPTSCVVRDGRLVGISWGAK